jgi:hypothetical protein
MQPFTPPSIALALTLDRGLRLDVEPTLLSLLAGWAPVASSSAPLVAVGPDTPLPAPSPVGPGAALVRVSRHHPARPVAPAVEPDVRLPLASAWVDDDRQVALVHGRTTGWGRVTLAHGTADIVAPHFDESDAAARDQVAGELRAMCTIAIALLTGRREGALVCASAVIAPDGGGWLVIGDVNSGKSTTAVHLVTAGWGYLADEEVLLHAGDRSGVWLEGWPRALPLDSVLPPYGRADATRRLRGEAAGVARGRWRRTAPLAGILTTRIAPDLPTQLGRATPDDALAGLVRATPWLLADEASTRYQLGLLRRATRVPAWTLRLGRDTHGDVVRLAHCLRPLEAAS